MAGRTSRLGNVHSVWLFVDIYVSGGWKLLPLNSYSNLSKGKNLITCKFMKM